MRNGEKLGVQTFVKWLKYVLSVAALCLLPAVAPAHAARQGLDVTVPNGYANITVDDLRLKSTAGDVKWRREWTGQEWKFNAHWENLSQSWKNLTGSQSADTTAGTVGTGSVGGAVFTSSSTPITESGCWIWVDEDWSPTASSGTQAAPMLPARTTTFNRTMSGAGSEDYAPAVSLSVDYASLCAGSVASSSQTLEGVRRLNELYLGEGGRYSFNNRTVLEKRSVQGLTLPGGGIEEKTYDGLLNLESHKAKITDQPIQTKQEQPCTTPRRTEHQTQGAVYPDSFVIDPRWSSQKS